MNKKKKKNQRGGIYPAHMIAAQSPIARPAAGQIVNHGVNKINQSNKYIGHPQYQHHGQYYAFPPTCSSTTIWLATISSTPWPILWSSATWSSTTIWLTTILSSTTYETFWGYN